MVGHEGGVSVFRVMHGIRVGRSLGSTLEANLQLTDSALFHRALLSERMAITACMRGQIWYDTAGLGVCPDIGNYRMLRQQSHMLFNIS